MCYFSMISIHKKFTVNHYYNSEFTIIFALNLKAMDENNQFDEFENTEIVHPKKKKNILEIIFSGIFIFGLLLFFLTYPGGHLAIIIGLLLLSILYSFFSFAILNGIPLRKIFKKESYQDIKALRIIGTILVGFCLSNGIFGILFKLMSWPGATFMLMIGSFGLLLSGIIILIKQMNQKSSLNSIILIRVAIIGSLAGILLFIPKSTLNSIRYGDNHPEYIEALKALEEDPENRELQNRVEQEYHKIRRNDGSR